MVDNTVVLVMAENCELALRGKAQLRCIRGVVESYGFMVEAGEKWLPIFSPNSHSLIGLLSSMSSKAAPVEEISLHELLKVELPYASKQQRTKIEDSVTNSSSVVLLKKLSCSVCDYVTRSSPFQFLFTRSVGESVGISLLDRELELLEAATNIMVMPEDCRNAVDGFVYSVKVGMLFISVLLYTLMSNRE